MKSTDVPLRRLTLAAALGLVACRGGDKATGVTDSTGDGLRFAAVSAGTGFACAVATGGAVYCWGTNTFGQLGSGIIDRSPIPAAVPFGLRFTAVTTAEHHTCALTTAGTAFCWGEIYGGSSFTPVAVPSGQTFAAISAGGVGHTCALTPAGAAYCWGDNRHGQLGDGSTTGSETPVAVAGGRAFVAISAGGDHTCAITATGAAYCWGANPLGQLGIGVATGPSECGYGPCSRIPAAVAGGLTFKSISASGSDGGSGHTCGVGIDGTTYCWGANGAGELGDGSTTNRSSPVRVVVGVMFVTVETGTDLTGNGDTCAITAAGAAYCWGNNLAGQLGDGTFTDRATPVPVAGGLTFAALTAGTELTCGRTTDSIVYCWGNNNNGALGVGDAVMRGSTVPLRVSGQS